MNPFNLTDDVNLGQLDVVDDAELSSSNVQTAGQLKAYLRLHQIENKSLGNISPEMPSSQDYEKEQWK